MSSSAPERQDKGKQADENEAGCPDPVQVEPRLLQEPQAQPEIDADGQQATGKRHASVWTAATSNAILKSAPMRVPAAAWPASCSIAQIPR